MRTLIYVLCIAALSFSVSCKKKVATVNSDYVGYWMGYDSDKSYSLVIGSDSKGVYESYGVGTITVRGTVKIKGDKLKIFTKKFSVDQAPAKDPSDPWTYTMVLDGVVYQRN
ncbi:hypothetical protein [Fluviicola sp.]|uniref:hypothetical protein n=1 Tax=Fluviicola sp. TaxID=1917219 RepID=UPI0031E14586